MVCYFLTKWLTTAVYLKLERELLHVLLQELNQSGRITPNIKRNLGFIRQYFKNERDRDLFDKAKITSDFDLLRELIQSIIKRNSYLHQSMTELHNIYEELEVDLSKFEASLSSSNIQYITHLNNNVLLLDTDAPQELLAAISNKVYLTAPISQIFLFLSHEDKDSIFHEFSSYDNGMLSNSYYDCVRGAKNDLSGFFTYDFASTELILESFKKASEEDLKLKRRSGEYGTMYDQLTTELKDFLDGKEISENEDGNKAVIPDALKNHV